MGTVKMTMFFLLFLIKKTWVYDSFTKNLLHILNFILVMPPLVVTHIKATTHCAQLSWVGPLKTTKLFFFRASNPRHPACRANVLATDADRRKEYRRERGRNLQGISVCANEKPPKKKKKNRIEKCRRLRADKII